VINLLLMVVLAALWGASFLFLRVAAPALGPFPTVALRVVVGALVLLLASVAVRRPITLRRHWRAFLVMGLTNAAIPFSLFSAAAMRLTASLGAILNATAPFFTALVAAVWLREPLTRGRVAGIAIGSAGVVVLVGLDAGALSSATLLSVAAIFAATFCYGMAAVYARTRIHGIDPNDFAIGQQLAASFWILPAVVLTAPPVAAFTPAVIGAVLGLGVLSTACAYLIYYRLIATVGPTPTLSVTFLIPVFGIFWGWLFLGEPVTPNLLVGMLIIFVGMALVLSLPLPSLRVLSVCK